MPDLDERLRQDLHRIAPEMAPRDEAFGRIVDRRSGRRRLLRVGRVALAFSVVIASAGAFAVLRHAFGGQEPASTPTPSSPSPLDGTWTVAGFDERGASGLVRPTGITLELSVEGRRYGGDLICNRYGGSLTDDAGRLVFGEPSVTAVACGDDVTPVDAYLDALSRVVAYTMDGKRLWLLGRSGRILVVAQPHARATEGREIGLGIPLCDIHTLDGVDMVGDGTEGTAWTGVYVTERGSCPTRPNAEYVVAVDVDGDGRADGSSYLSSCEGCEPYAVTDFDADGVDELIVLTEATSTPTYEVFFWLGSGRPRASGLYGASVWPHGAPAAGFPARDSFSLTAGGDEGFSAAIDCESYPEDPVLVVAHGNAPVDGSTREVYVTKLRYGGHDEDKHFSIVSEQHVSQSVGDPLPVPSPETACGVDWTPF